MKAILTIGGDSYLIHATSDLNKIIDLLADVTCVRAEHLYGPDKARYAEPYYVSRQVMAAQPAEISVTLVADAKVVNQKEWADITAKHEKACAEFAAHEAKTVSAGS